MNARSRRATTFAIVAVMTSIVCLTIARAEVGAHFQSNDNSEHF